MKKYILLSLGIFSMFAFFTYPTSSTFTDQEKSENNFLSAGTLDLTVHGVNDIQSFSFNNLAPGSSESYSYTLKNTGSISGKLKICIRNVDNIESTGTTEYESQGSTGDLGSVVLINTKINSESLVDIDTTIDSLNNFCWSPDNIEDIEFVSTGADILDFNESVEFTIGVNLPTSAGNKLQGDSLNFDIEFNLEQN